MDRMQTSYPNLRENLHPSMRRLSDQRIEAVLGQAGIDAEAAEGFFQDLGKIASGVGKAALSAAPAVLPGVLTAAGTAFLGPVGGMIGGQLGRVAAGAISGSAGGPSGPAPAALAGGSSAAGQLLQAVTRPETLKALMSMMLGAAGAPTVRVGAAPVGVGAFSNLLGVLAGRAAAEYNTSAARPSESTPAYLRDYAGEAVADAAVPEQRADALLELLEATQPEQAGEAFGFEATESYEALEAYADAQAEAEAEAWELLDAIDAFESE